MKRQLALILSVLFLTIQPVYSEEFPYIGEVTGDKVNVRAGQHTNFEKVDMVNTGDQVVVLGKEFTWYKIKLGPTAKAYVSSQFVQMVKDNIGQVTGNRLNVRAESAPQASIIGQIAKGEYVKILGQEGDWYQIEPLDDMAGWIHEDFLVFKSKNVPESVPQDLAAAVAEPEEPVKTEEAKEAKSDVSIIGEVRPIAENMATNQTAFALVVDGKVMYYLRAHSPILKEFNNATVKVDGQFSVGEDAEHPIVLVERINFVL